MSIQTERHIVRAKKGPGIVLMQTQQRFASLIDKNLSNLTTYKCLYIIKWRKSFVFKRHFSFNVYTF